MQVVAVKHYRGRVNQNIIGEVHCGEVRIDTLCMIQWRPGAHGAGLDLALLLNLLGSGSSRSRFGRRLKLMNPTTMVGILDLDRQLVCIKDHIENVKADEGRTPSPWSWYIRIIELVRVVHTSSLSEARGRTISRSSLHVWDKARRAVKRLR